MTKAEKPLMLYRDVMIEPGNVTPDSREVALAFSSEKPVERYDWETGQRYLEVLDHGPGNADFSRLNNGGAFLVNHDTDEQVGAVKRGSAVVGEDRIGRAIVKLSRSDDGEEILQDMRDEIRTLVSFGYKTTKELSRTTSAGVETRRYAFQALEISTVPIPADDTVGVGRSEPPANPTPNSAIPQKTMSTVIDTPAPAPSPGLTIGNEPSNARNRESSEIRAIANQLENRIPNIRQMAEDAIVLNTPLAEFRATAVSMLPKPQPVQPAKPIDIKPKEWERYSLSRAITSKLAGKLDGFEKEMSDEVALRNGKQPEGFFVPDEAMVSKRNAIAGTATLGGMLVQTDNLASQFIEVLRNKSQVINLGAQVINLTRQATIPRQNGASTANWINGETAASTLSGVNLQQITLAPKTVAALVQFSKMLLLESDPSIDNILRNDLAAQIGLAIDLATLHGAGSSGEPAGILATTGIGSVLLATDGLAINNTTAYPAMVSLESVVAAANADGGSLAYLMRPAVRGQLKTTSRFSSTNTPVWENGMVNGYRAEVSNQVSKVLTTGTATTITTPVFFGNWNEVIIASFGATDIVVDEYTAAINRVVKIYAHRLADVGIRHAASFSVLGGVLNG